MNESSPITAESRRAALGLLLDTPLPGGTRGRPQKQDFFAIFERELSEADLPALHNPPAVPAASLEKLRHVHHEAAKLIANGNKDIDVAAIVGMTPTRIWQLKQDPAFQELLAHYEGQKEAIFADALEQLKNLGLSALQEIQERLAENPKSFSLREVLDVMKESFDRSVAPSKGAPKGASGGSTAIAVNLQFVRAEPQGPLIEHEPEE
jgi:hypothetical protein